MATIEQAVAAHAVIGLDTSILIYHLEAYPDYLPLTTAVLNRVQRGECQAVVSTVALMELTVHPWRRNQPMIARQYETLLIHFPHLHLADITREVARRAAQVRAGSNVRPADALHVAAALVNGATAYITNDKGLARLDPLLAVVVLDDFVDRQMP